MNLLILALTVGGVALIVWLLTYKLGLKAGQKTGREKTLLEIHELADKNVEKHSKLLESRLRAIARLRRELRMQREASTRPLPKAAKP